MKLPLEDHFSAEQFSAIGLVIAQWASIEDALRYVLCDLVTQGKNETDYAPALVLTAGMSYRVILGMIRSLAYMSFPSEEKELKKILDAIENSATKRDIFAHSSWKKGDKPDYIATDQFKSVSRLTHTPRQYSTAEIREIAFEMHQRVTSLIDFLSARGAFRHPSQIMP